MKINYVSDDYGKDVMGTKTSLFHELKRRGFDVVWTSVHAAGHQRIDAKQLEPADVVCIVHSWWTMANKNKLAAMLIGFGLSDPTGFSIDRVEQCDGWVTADLTTYRHLHQSKSTWMPPACDCRFHRRYKCDKSVDVLFYGTGTHPAMGSYRNDVVRHLQNALPELSFAIYGTKWDGDIEAMPPVRGGHLIDAINQSRLGVDIATASSPMARRIFEMSACGTPVICRDREDIRRLMNPHRDCLLWNSIDDLTETISEIVTDDALLDYLSQNAYQQVRSQHDISNRCDGFLKWLSGLPS